MNLLDWLHYVAEPMRFLLDPLLSLFQHGKDFAPALATALLLAAVVILIYVYVTHYWPLTATVQARLLAMRLALKDARTHDEAREQFFRHFGAVEKVMLDERGGGRLLAHAWIEFKETWVDPHESPVKNTTRAIDHFGSVPLGTVWLTFWANTFVGVGLLLTFIGIIAALKAAVDGIDGGQDMQQALPPMLAASTAKFFTSIAGLGAAILLRIFDRIWASRLQHRVVELCDLIERGLAYTPVQQISVQQLKELQEQTTAIKRFSTDLAVSIGQTFDQALAPLIAATSNMGQSLSGLANLGDTLKDVGNTVQGGGQDAAAQIRSAAGAFNQAADAVRGSFGEVVGQIGSLVRQMADTHGKANQDLFDKFQTAFDKLEETTAGNADKLQRTVADIAAAGTKASGAIEGSLRTAAMTAGREAAKQVRDATSELSEALRVAASDLRSQVGDAASRLAELNNAIAAQMDRFKEIGHQAALLNGEIARTTQAFGDVSRPFVAGTEKLSNAAERLEQSAASIVSATTTASAALAKAATDAAQAGRMLSETQRDTTVQWQEYSRRFAEIDRSVAQAVKGVVDQFAASLERLSEHVGKIDMQFAKATSNLNASVTQLKELVEELEEAREPA